jgi:hypothetical protein
VLKLTSYNQKRVWSRVRHTTRFQLDISQAYTRCTLDGGQHQTAHTLYAAQRITIHFTNPPTITEPQHNNRMPRSIGPAGIGRRLYHFLILFRKWLAGYPCLFLQLIQSLLRKLVFRRGVSEGETTHTRIDTSQDQVQQHHDIGVVTICASREPVSTGNLGTNLLPYPATYSLNHSWSTSSDQQDPTQAMTLAVSAPHGHADHRSSFHDIPRSTTHVSAVDMVRMQNISAPNLPHLRSKVSHSSMRAERSRPVSRISGRPPTQAVNRSSVAPSIVGTSSRVVTTYL